MLFLLIVECVPAFSHISHMAEVEEAIVDTAPLLVGQHPSEDGAVLLPLFRSPEGQLPEVGRFERRPRSNQIHLKLTDDESSCDLHIAHQATVVRQPRDTAVEQAADQHTDQTEDRLRHAKRLGALSAASLLEQEARQ